jgi:hypothetical protein
MRERKRPAAAIAVLLGAVLLIAAASCSLKQDHRTAAPAVGKTEKTSPASAKKSYAEPDASFVANPFCKACHVDFDEEELVVRHKVAGIGCERCHGESLRHRSDEANVTPPELMYAKERVNPTCMMCHPRHEIRQVESHRPVLEANLSVLETAPPAGQARRYCTDCHGREHRMKVRTIRWDKYTGKLAE